MRVLTIVLLAIASARAFALDLDGHTDFAQRLQLNSAVSARVESVAARVGQQVAAGDLLLSLETTGLQARVDIASAEVAELAPALQKMLSEKEKAQELFDRDSLAQVELQTAEQNHAIAAARLAAAQARLTHARYRLAQARIQSPIHGIVLSIDAFPGQFVNTRVSDKTLLTIADNQSMRARALLPLELWQHSLLHRSAAVSFQQQRYQGKVIQVGRQLTSGDNNHPAAILVVEFSTDGKLPAGLPVKITVADE